MNEILQSCFGRKIVAVRVPASQDVPDSDFPFTGFDLVFDDGSELEIYVVDGAIAMVHLSPDEAKAEAERKDEQAGLPLSATRHLRQ